MGEVPDLLTQAATLAAQDHRERRCQVRVPKIHAAMRCGGNDAISFVPEEVHGELDAFGVIDRQPQEASHRAAQRLRLKRIGCPRTSHQRIHTRRFRHAGDGPQIARIPNVRRHDHYARLELGERTGGPPADGEGPLGRSLPGESSKDALGYLDSRHVRAFERGDEPATRFTFGQGDAYQSLLEPDAAFECLPAELEAFEDETIVLLAAGTFLKTAHGLCQGILGARDRSQCKLLAHASASRQSGPTRILCYDSSVDFLRKLKDEIKALEQELHVSLPKELKAAREHGDLSENAEYHAAKERQGYVNARLGQLRKRLAELSMVNFDKLPRDRISLGSEVHLYEINKKEEVVYRLVMSEEADAQRGLISTTSPIGRALMGKEEGDEVRVQTPAGSKVFEIVKLVTIYDLLESETSE